MNYPFLKLKTKQFLAKIRKIILRFDNKALFSDIYFNNRYGSKDSVSGTGSDLTQTAEIRQQMPILLKSMNAKSLLDAPCGDFYWMRHANLNLDKYIGIDIVPELIEKNQNKYGGEVNQFKTMDIIKDNLPEVDIILCRDCLVHLSFKDAISAINNFKKSKSRYLLTTSFTRLENNNNIVTGDWRTLNLQLPPFNFPKPIALINEKCTEGNAKYSDKCLGLWKLEDIQL